MSQYQRLRDKYQSEFLDLKKQYDQLSRLRLVLALALLFLIFKAFSQDSLLYWTFSAVVFAVFAFVVSKHQKITWESRLTDKLKNINQIELNYLEKNEKPFYNGADYIDTSHAYSYDLDVFGDHSLFHNLNRTSTYIGQSTFSKLLLTLLPNDKILANQKAITELTDKLTWRQDFMLYGQLTNDNEAEYAKVIKWTKESQSKITGLANVLSYLLPALFILSIVAVATGFLSARWIGLAVIFNVTYTGFFLKKIKSEVIDSKRISQLIKHYSLIFKTIESESLKSERLIALQAKLINTKASKETERLSKNFLKIQGINFELGAFLLNGSVLYHIHALRTLLDWKEKNAENLQTWLEVVGEFDALTSLANFSYNNPEFSYPVLNQNQEVLFKDLGHPLIKAKGRVTNSISLEPSNFVILTGSNMSGKSTFLRSLGINMILSGIGSPVCSTEASIHPLPVLVSMRQSDSLSSGESYFFAEVKRLKGIMDKLEQEPCFVLLDEILRGTNSDDKQTGTIGVIQKIISRPAVGVIATHDLEVCKLTDQFPDKLENKCFEVEIKNDELMFDYKLREGVCQNKSATFLMEKMEII